MTSVVPVSIISRYHIAIITATLPVPADSLLERRATHALTLTLILTPTLTLPRSIYVGIHDPLCVAASIDRAGHVHIVLRALQR